VTGPADGRPPPDQLTREQLVELGGELDAVRVVSKVGGGPGWGTRPEKRAERRVALWFVLSMLLAVAFVVCYLAWPDQYVAPGEPGATLYALNTPVLGITFGGAVLALGLGVVAYTKRFFPDEVAVQQREPLRSDDVDRATAVARFAEAAEDTGLTRRRLPRRVLLGAAGLVGLIAAVLPLGTFVRNPWRGGNAAALWSTGWRPVGGETVYLRSPSAVLGEVVRVRPEDMQPGAMLSVVPFRETERGHVDLMRAAERAADGPVMLIRFRPGTAVTPLPGHEGFGYGDYAAFSKVCTHLGCPAALYDAQDDTALCPCHQSAFLMTEGARPVFGPATRPLPQLPIDVDDEGYFVARGDFAEPVGPAFWEVRAAPPAGP
jgi:ubiquinol-cytochrome c reductase iron-sulfur subunit